MTSKLYDSGKNIICRILSGEQIKINGMYVTSGNTELSDCHDASYSYFEALKQGNHTGVARVPISSVKVEKGSIIFTALLTAEDFQGAPITADTAITSAVLVCMKDDRPINDEFVYCTLFKSNLKIVHGAYMTVVVGMKIGE